MKEIKIRQFYRLPSSHLIRISGHLTNGDWNCIYEDGEDVGSQLMLSTAFLMKHGERT